MRIRPSLTTAASAIVLTAIAAGTAGAQMMAADAPMGESRVIQVTIENLTTGQNFSPAFFASFGADAPPLFALGQSSTEQLWSVAEGGNIGPYSSAAAAALASGSLGSAAVAVHTPPGATRTLYISVDAAHPLLSGVWMLGMTNDGFGGLEAVDAWALTGPVTIDIKGYDAGSERNNEARGFLGALGEGNMRDPEDGVVTIHTGIRGDADAPIAWNFDPNLVARVTLTPVAVAP
jgi:hypothetical protein